MHVCDKPAGVKCEPQLLVDVALIERRGKHHWKSSVLFTQIANCVGAIINEF